MVSAATVKAVTPLNMLLGRAPQRNIGFLPFSMLVKSYAQSMSQCKKQQCLDIGTEMGPGAHERELAQVRAEVDEVLLSSLLQNRAGKVRSLFGEQLASLPYDSLPLLQVPGYNDEQTAIQEDETNSPFGEDPFRDDSRMAAAKKPVTSSRLFVQEDTLLQGSSSTHVFHVLAPDAIVDPAFIRFIRNPHQFSNATTTTTARPPIFVIPFSTLHAGLSATSDEDLNAVRVALGFLTRALTGPQHHQFVVIPPSVEMGWVVSLPTQWAPTLANVNEAKPAVLHAVMEDPLARSGYAAYVAQRRWHGVVRLCTSVKGRRYQSLVSEPFGVISTSPSSMGILQLATKSASHGSAINGCASAAESLRRRLQH